MTTTQDAEFQALMGYLEGWYADAVKATAYDGPSRSAHTTDGPAPPRVNRYPGPPWRRLYYEADEDPVAKAAIIHALEEEIYGLSHSPSQAGPASGLHHGTQEWRRAVASADGSLRAVARRFGISHTEVRRLRLAERR